MFHIDATFEDIRLVASSDDGIIAYNCTSYDSMTGKSFNFQATPIQLSYIMEILLDIDGTPQGVGAMYEVLEPLFINCPNECRPIP